MGVATLTPYEFVDRWERVPQSERAKAQPQFLDICHLLGQPTPIEADPRGEWYAFEKRVTRADGTKGFADIWMRDHFAWEYKGEHGDLDAAYRQILTYREPLENPPLLIVSDTVNFQIHTNFTRSAKAVHQFTLHDLRAPGPRDLLRRVFEEPDSFNPRRTRSQVTREAAAHFAGIADGLRDRGIPAQRAAHFLTQLLFCLFAEDVRLLPQETFARVIRRSTERPGRFVPLVRDLFETMRTGGEFLLSDIPWFNGGLFADVEPIELMPDEIARLRDVAALDWGNIDTTIIGTLFERSLDPDKRGQFGMHYTRREDIMKVIAPVVLAPLHREWANVRVRAEKLRESAETAPTTAIRRNRQEDLRRLLRGFKARLASVTVLDPACGSGNFLSVTLGALLDLEKEVSLYAGMAGVSAMFPEVRPRQMYGLEVNPYALELAQVGVWITFLQWMNANGFEPDRDPVLQPLDTIRLQDALIEPGDSPPRRPREVAWPEADYIVGNPPFLGGNKLRLGLGDERTDALFEVYAGRVPAFADMVCYWFEKARAQIAGGRTKRAGLIATNSIRGGASRRVLERIKDTGDIFAAWPDEDWVLDGADVRISIVGFDNGSEQERQFGGLPVVTINADLSAAIDLTGSHRLTENGELCFMGASPKGPFDIDEAEAASMLAAPSNIDGRPNVDVIRPVLSAIDIMRVPRRKWTIDFALLPYDEAIVYEAPFQYVRRHVFPIRSTNRRALYAQRWWQYGEARPGMREALRGRDRFIATPAVAKHRVFVWVESQVLCNQGTLVFARSDDYFFGVLHSRIHELWSLRMCTYLGIGNDPRYTPTTTFETFPFPWPPGSEPNADDPFVATIAAAAARLVAYRDAWLNPPGATPSDPKTRTLTTLYNERPALLAMLHDFLDKAVLDAYGWPHDLSDDDLLARLLALNLERARGEDAAALPAANADEAAD